MGFVSSSYNHYITILKNTSYIFVIIVISQFFLRKKAQKRSRANLKRSTGNFSPLNEIHSEGWRSYPIFMRNDGKIGVLF